MMNQVKDNADQKMKKCIDAYRQELSKIRTGRAHPSLLDHVTVNFYGSQVPLSKAANITVLDARTLNITPWDKNMVQAIEKAILTSDLGLNPATSGTTIRVPLPPLTEERRKDMLKIAKGEAENARVSVRNIRRDANNELKQLLKDKKTTEDEERRAQEQIQKLTDTKIAEIDKILQDKEKDLLSI